MTLQLLEKDRGRIRNLLEKEIKKGYKLVTEDFTGFDPKGLAGRIGACISSVNTLSDELDDVLSKMSLTVQGSEETIMFEKQMDSDFAVIEIAFDLNSTLGLMERLTLNRVTRGKELALSPKDFENICKAINRIGPLQVDQILISHQGTKTDYQSQQRGHATGENAIQQYSVDIASDTLHANIYNSGVAFDSCEFTPGIQLKRERKSRQRKKTKEEDAVQDSLSAENNGPKCYKHGIKQPRRRNKAEMKKGGPRKKRQAKLNKEMMPQYWRHNWFTQQNERYMTRKENREPRGKSELYGSSQLHVVKRETRLYKRKAEKWKNKPKKRHKKRKKNKGLTTSTKWMIAQH